MYNRLSNSSKSGGMGKLAELSPNLSPDWRTHNYVVRETQSPLSEHTHHCGTILPLMFKLLINL
jgi:hypothetical protein